MFIAIIPAQSTLDIINTIRKKYAEHFGKVSGKLPLHIGLIFFKRKMPTFAVLDAASRMLKEFENGKEATFEVVSIKDGDTHRILELKPKKMNYKYIIRVPYKLRDGNIDYYHPYLTVKDANDDVIEVKIDNETITQKHILKIKEEDKIKMKNYYFDFELLDSNIRRFDIGKNRRHWLFTESTNTPKPYLLWDIDNFERLRKLIKKLELTTTQIMNLYEMLMAKLEEWGIRKPPLELLNGDNEEDKKKAKVFEIFVENAIKDIPLKLRVVDVESRRGRISEKDFEFLKDAIMSGLFFDFVDLWHTILKKKFEEGDEYV